MVDKGFMSGSIYATVELELMSQGYLCFIRFTCFIITSYSS